jgi:SAM-dependent methyltransferase
MPQHYSLFILKMSEVGSEIQKYELEKKAQIERDRIGKQLYNDTYQTFEQLFEEYPTSLVRGISRQWREENGYNDESLAYGDIIFRSYHELFIKIYNYGIKYDSRGTFADIGSGSGRALFASMLIHNFSRVIGIEILKPLCEVNRKVRSIIGER